MARKEIIGKLDIFFKKHTPFTEECHVVYLLVEIRKVLDRENNLKYPILRFYCNWSVHIDKYRTSEIDIIMNDIYKSVEKDILYPALISRKTKVIHFMYMEDLQDELKLFLTQYKLPILLTDQNNWIEFVKLFMKILADQPIKNLRNNIKQFAFLPAADGCVRGRIDFKQKIGKYNHYNFGNAY